MGYFTAPSGPSSINNNADAIESTKHCFPEALKSAMREYDAFLVACYSDHPLVHAMVAHPDVINKTVLGIFQASVYEAASPGFMSDGEKFGIVSTGKIWEHVLSEAISHMDDSIQEAFVGVETTGLSATELHDMPKDVVEAKMNGATRRLLKRGQVGAICLGCAGMAGLDKVVQQACVDELGVEGGRRVRIIDGVVAGVERIRDVLYK